MSFKDLKNKITTARNWSSIPKWLRVLTLSLLTIGVFLIAVFVAISWYVNSNKKVLMQQMTSLVAENLNGGQLEVKDIDVALWRTFPNLAIHLKHVSLSDSLYVVHQKKLFYFKDVYVRLKPLSLLSKQPKISKVFLANGTVYMFKDTNNYSNVEVFTRPQSAVKKPGNFRLEVADYAIDNVNFVFDNFLRNKKFELDIHEIDGNLKVVQDALEFNVNLDVTIGQLGFNLQKGGFLTDTKVKGPLRATFNVADNQLEVSNQRLKADGMPVVVSGKFNFAPDNKEYTLVIDGRGIDFSKSRAMLSKHIANKLKVIEVRKPIDIYATINGELQYPDTPVVVVNFLIKNNAITIPIGDIDNANVQGRFTNRFKAGAGYGNDNTVIFIDKMNGALEGVPMVLDASYVLDFAKPKIYCKIKSSFPVERLDELAGSSFNLKNGIADLDIFYSGPLTPDDTFPRSMNGYVYIKNASLSYLPRNLRFDNCNATIQFDDQDVIFHTVDLESKSSSLHLDGIGKNFLSAYFNDANKALFDIDIKSKQINLDEFKSFLVARKTGAAGATDGKVRFVKINEQLDKALAQSDMMLDVRIDKVNYRKFNATNIRAEVNLLASGLTLRNVNINHAGGNIRVDGSIQQKYKANPFKVNAQIEQVDIAALMTAFENFGLEGITAENLKGRFNGNIAVAGGIDEFGSLMQRSLQGNISFKLQDGELHNFTPLLQIQKYAFKSRNLAHVRFKELSNTLQLQKGLITIPPMEIISSAIYMRVQGVYGIDRGTDIALEIPLRNPKKDEALIAQGKSAKRMKGLVLNLRAQDDGNGKIKLNWDPRKTGLKEIELRRMEQEDSLKMFN